MIEERSKPEGSSGTDPGAGRERCEAILVAAGRGERLMQEVPKSRVLLGGEPLFLHSLRALRGIPRIERIHVVVPPLGGEVEAAHGIAARAFGESPGPAIRFLSGGEERQDSVWAALDALYDFGTPEDAIILIHDAARPFLTDAFVNRCLEAIGRPRPTGRQAELPGLTSRNLWGHGPSAVIPGLPIRETLKLVFEGRVVLTQPRENLYSVQTPQVFRYGPLYQAHRRARRHAVRVTDDASLLEWQGIPVFLVPGETANLKITYPEDLALAERLLASSPRPAEGGARGEGVR